MSFQGTTIRGDLSLDDGFESDSSIAMYGVRIAGDLSLEGAKLTSKTKTFSIDNAEINGAVYLLDFSCTGPFWMLNAKVGNALLATNARFGSSVAMTGTSVQGDLMLGGVRSLDQIDLGHTVVAGDVALAGAVLEGKQTSLSLRDATIRGNVYLMDGFHASGALNCWGAVIKQGLFVADAELAELNCTDAQIGGVLVWAGLRNPNKTKLTLVRTNVKEFRDVKTSWPSKGNLRLGGFVYELIALNVPPDVADLEGKTLWKPKGTNPDERLSWLRLQSDQDMQTPQPWLQLSRYLDTNGDSEGARHVLDMMKKAQAKSLLVYYYEHFVDYPEYVVVPICLFWIFGSVIFWRARRMQAMAPTDKDAYEHFIAKGKPPDYYVPFSPVVYALENVLPIAKFGQDNNWAPNPQNVEKPASGWQRWLPRMSYRWLAILRWVLVVLGWFLVAILAGVISKIFKS
jgi:hypothetical protein